MYVRLYVYIYIYICVYGSYIYNILCIRLYIYVYLYVFPTSSMYNINIHINKWTNKITDTHIRVYIYGCVVIPPINPFFRPGKLPWNVSQPWPERPWSWRPWPDPWLRPRTRRRCRNGPPGWTPTSFQIGLSIKRQAMGPWGLLFGAVFLWDIPKRKDGGDVPGTPPWLSEEVWSSWPSFRNTQGDNKENKNYVNMSLLRLSDVCASCSVSYFDMVFGLYFEHEILKHGLPSGKTNSKASPILPEMGCHVS
jgi:hypothetical protein